MIGGMSLDVVQYIEGLIYRNPFGIVPSIVNITKKFETYTEAL